MNFREKGLQE